MAQITGREARYQAYLAMLKEDFTPYAQIEVLNPDGTIDYVIGNEFIQQGEVNVNFNNGTRRTASVTLENTYKRRAISPDSLWFGQQFRIKAGLYLPDNTPYTLPQGVFYIKDPERRLAPNEHTFSLNLTDKWAYLDGTLFGNLEGNFVAEINQDIYELVSAILALDRGNGYPIDNVTPLLDSYFLEKEVQLPDGTIVPVTNVPYEMRVEPEGKTYADVLLELNNMLTGIIGYDNSGRLCIEPSNYDIADYEKANLWDFSPYEREFLGATYSVKMSEVYNVVQVIGAILNGMQAQGEVYNEDSTSPLSIQGALGRRVKRITDSNYYSDEQCLALGMWHLKRLNILQQSVSFTCSPIYHLHENMLVSVYNPQKNGKNTPHLINGYTLPLDGSEMRVDVTSIEESNSVLSQSVVVTRVLAAEPEVNHSITSSVHKAYAAIFQASTSVDIDANEPTLITDPPSALAVNTQVFEIDGDSSTLYTDPSGVLAVNTQVFEIDGDGSALNIDPSIAMSLSESVVTGYYADLLAHLVADCEAETSITVSPLSTMLAGAAASAEVSEDVAITVITPTLVACYAPQMDASSTVTTAVSISTLITDLAQDLTYADADITVELSTPDLITDLSQDLNYATATVSHEVSATLVATLNALYLGADERIRTKVVKAKARTIPTTPISATLDASTSYSASISTPDPLHISGSNSANFGVYLAEIVLDDPTPLYASSAGYHGYSLDNMVLLPPTALSATLSSTLSAIAIAISTNESVLTAALSYTLTTSATAYADEAAHIVASIEGTSSTTVTLVWRRPSALSASAEGVGGQSSTLSPDVPTELASATVSGILNDVANLTPDAPTEIDPTSVSAVGSASVILSVDLPTALSATLANIGSATATTLGYVPMPELAATISGIFSISTATITFADGDIYATMASTSTAVSTLSYVETLQLIADASGTTSLSPNLATDALNETLGTISGQGGQSASMSIITYLSLPTTSLAGTGGSTASIGTIAIQELTATVNGTQVASATLGAITNYYMWNRWYELGTISGTTAELIPPPTDMSGEIHLTYTTDSSLNATFWNFTLPSGYCVVENDFSDIIEEDGVYESTLYNTGQEDENGDIIIGISTIKWA